MNLKKEFEIFNQSGYSALENNLNNIIQEAKDKKYLFNVICILKQLQTLVDSNYFKDIPYISFCKDFDIYSSTDSYANSSLINFEFLDSFEHPIPLITHKYELNTIKKLLDLNSLKLPGSLINDSFKHDKVVSFPIDSQLSNKLKQIFLNDKLLLTLQHYELSNQIEQKTDSKKHKI